MKDKDHPCLHDSDLTDMRIDLQDIRTVLGIKDITNGDIRRRMKELGEITEKEDNKLSKDISNIYDRLDTLQKLMIQLIIAGFGVIGTFVVIIIFAIRMY